MGGFQVLCSLFSYGYNFATELAWYGIEKCVYPGLGMLYGIATGKNNQVTACGK